jgi:hypothetical protein
MGFPPGEKQGEARRKPRPAKNLGKPKIANAVALRALRVLRVLRAFKTVAMRGDGDACRVSTSSEAP